ncbi:MAG: hypothetical protein ABSB40_14185, partial [Nitrososphaeria archaeon]
MPFIVIVIPLVKVAQSGVTSTAPRYPLAVAKGMLYIFFSGDFLPGLSIVCVLNLEKSGASS